MVEVQVLYNLHFLHVFNLRYFRAPHDSAKIASFRKISCFVYALFECLNAGIKSTTNTLQQDFKAKILALQNKNLYTNSYINVHQVMQASSRHFTHAPSRRAKLSQV